MPSFVKADWDPAEATVKISREGEKRAIRHQAARKDHAEKPSLASLLTRLVGATLSARVPVHAKTVLPTLRQSPCQTTAAGPSEVCRPTPPSKRCESDRTLCTWNASSRPSDRGHVLSPNVRRVVHDQLVLRPILILGLPRPSDVRNLHSHKEGPMSKK